MKNFIFLIFFYKISIISLFSKDLIVDSNLSNGNGSTFFNSLTEAVNASSDGDIILVKDGNYSYEEILIDKSIKIRPFDVNSLVRIKSNIKVEFKEGNKIVEIIGLDLTDFSIKTWCKSCTDFSEVNIIRVKAKLIQARDQEKLLTNVFNSEIEENVLVFGNVIKNKISGHLSVGHYTEMVGNPKMDEKLLILGNEIGGKVFYEGKHPSLPIDVGYSISVAQEARELIIANNKCEYGLVLGSWDYREGKTNLIHNNEFKSLFLISNDKVPRYNIKITSNKWTDLLMSRLTCSECTRNYVWSSTYYDMDNYISNIAYSGPLEFTRDFDSNYPDVSTPGFFIFTYNGVDYRQPYNYVSNVSALNFDFILGQNDPIDGGDPSHYFYDLDLTVNNRGVNGGPFSGDNLKIEGTDDLKAYIYYIDSPSDVFSGDKINLKVKGYINGN
tara:strand:+ start:1189 stop:2514 length:1326 start_codon:yes stop_codon:yes gene_type:complete